MSSAADDPDVCYVLRLKEAKFYVGATRGIYVRRRVAQHFFGHGARWTQRYKPVGLIGVFAGSYDIENYLTLVYMNLYGHDNVRGGEWFTTRDIEEPEEIRDGRTLPERKLENVTSHYFEDLDVSNTEEYWNYTRPFWAY